MQPQKPSYTATGSFRKPRQPIKSLRPKQNHPYRSENQPQSSMSNTRTDFPKGVVGFGEGVLYLMSPGCPTDTGLPASVAQLDASSDWRPGGRGFNPRQGRQHSFVEIDHEIFSTVILSLPLIQEGQLSVSGERMCTILVNRLEV